MTKSEKKRRRKRLRENNVTSTGVSAVQEPDTKKTRHEEGIDSLDFVDSRQHILSLSSGIFKKLVVKVHNHS